MNKTEPAGCARGAGAAPLGDPAQSGCHAVEELSHEKGLDTSASFSRAAHFCAECLNSGLLNHADVAAYWDAADAAVSGWKDEGIHSRGFGPGPVEEPCLDCPLCASCGYEVRLHDPEALVGAAAEEPGSHFWSLPACSPVRDARGHLVPARRVAR